MSGFPTCICLSNLPGLKRAFQKNKIDDQKKNLKNKKCKKIKKKLKNLKNKKNKKI